MNTFSKILGNRPHKMPIVPYFSRLITCICLWIMLQNVHAESPDTLNHKRLRTVIAVESGFYLSGNVFLQYIWYRDHNRTPFHYYNDNKGWMQLDKCGHAFGAYHYSRLGYDALRWAGVSRKKALLFGAPLGFVMQAPIEVFDGLYEGYGFSKGDMIANACGSLLFGVQQALWDAQPVKLKFSYSPSGYSKYNPYTLGNSGVESFFMDYNGHTYWLSLNAGDVFKSNPKIPKWLSLAFGYSANGMLREFSNPLLVRGNPVPDFPRYRQYLLSLDVDLSKIKTKCRFLSALFKQLNTLKIPFPALEYNTLGRYTFRPFYF